MLLAVVSFLFLPWLDRSPVKSMRYRGWISRTALDAVRGVVPRCSGTWACSRRRALRDAGAHLRGLYFAFFSADAVLHAHRQVKPVPERVTFHAH